MKKINSFLLIFGLLFGATACTNWLSEDQLRAAVKVILNDALVAALK